MSRAGRLAALVCGAILVAPAFAGAKDAAAPARATSAPERTFAVNFKDLVLSHCIATAYAADAGAKADATASAGALLEWGSFDLEGAGAEIEALVRRTLAQDYASFAGPTVRLDLLKCIDMAHGPALDELTRRFVSDPEMTYERANGSEL